MRVAIFAALMATSLSACATSPKVATGDGKEVDIRQRGSIGRLTGVDVPLSLCSKGARLACATGLLGSQCYRVSSMCMAGQAL